jgi:hypothetical protein
MVQRSAFATKQFDLWNLASGLSKSDLVPRHFQGKPANCFLALQMAERMNLDMFAVMSNLYVVHGTPALSSKFLIGLANTSGVFRGNLRFTFTGEGRTLAARCSAILRETGDEVSITVTLAQADAAGWTKDKPRRDGGVEVSKYKIMPQQMLAYRAAAFFVRLYCPEATFGGARTIDELEDMHAAGVGPQADYRDAQPVRQDPLSLELAAQATAAQTPHHTSTTTHDNDNHESNAADSGCGALPDHD